MHCKNCDSMLEDNIKTCPYCGENKNNDNVIVPPPIYKIKSPLPIIHQPMFKASQAVDSERERANLNSYLQREKAMIIIMTLLAYCIPSAQAIIMFLNLQYVNGAADSLLFVFIFIIPLGFYILIGLLRAGLYSLNYSRGKIYSELSCIFKIAINFILVFLSYLCFHGFFYLEGIIMFCSAFALPIFFWFLHYLLLIVLNKNYKFNKDIKTK